MQSWWAYETPLKNIKKSYWSQTFEGLYALWPKSYITIWAILCHNNDIYHNILTFALNQVKGQKIVYHFFFFVSSVNITKKQY